MGNGKVYLVGAGPSDVGLLTLKGKQVLEQAEVVVYDRLVGQSILLLIPQHAEKIDVGKRAGHHTVPQEEINRILLKKAQECKRVVRLKGGDPFLFGRGGEELELLAQHGIAYEVVPGVTSAIAVPAYNGIPVTHRDAASSLHIITGHQRQGQPLSIDFEALVRTRGTLVFLMGVTALPDICRGLEQAGMAGDTPAAILQQGTTANQKKILATVATLPDAVRRQTIQPPAILVVGAVCRYAQEFSWREEQPLFGAKLLVTRPRERSSALAEPLRALGAQVLEIPTIRTVPIDPNPRLEQELDRLDSYDVLAFTSPAGVQTFWQALARRGMDIRSFGRGKIASIGAGTTKELARYGIVADWQPEQYDGVHLGELIARRCADGDRILLPRSRQGGQELVELLARRGQIELVDLPLYDTVSAAPELIDLKAELESGTVTMVLFTSASTVHGFHAATPGMDYSGVTAACIGAQTQRAADALGMRTFVAEHATLESLTKLAVRIYHKA